MGQLSDNKKTGIIALVGLSLVILAIVYSGDDNNDHNNELSKYTAYNISQDFVKRFLKTPATAKFPSFQDITVQNTSENTFIVKAYVDSQNLFGALVRNDYLATVSRQSPNSDTWNLVSLEIDDNRVK
ncbi:hypothetical protein [Parabacteroides sp. Marseille-P3160]|uniref:hypothetical protein n=1 Tax=Parabacteroides sp. Marseille-P3160 TaxID=1917887 RepID=UPI0009BC1733|nr:hypothetical protein [Parabacteroides sp. Marseille-P3160]